MRTIITSMMLFITSQVYAGTIYTGPNPPAPPSPPPSTEFTHFVLNGINTNTPLNSGVGVIAYGVGGAWLPKNPTVGEDSVEWWLLQDSYNRIGFALGESLFSNEIYDFTPFNNADEIIIDIGSVNFDEINETWMLPYQITIDSILNLNVEFPIHYNSTWIPEPGTMLLVCLVSLVICLSGTRFN